MKALIHNQTVIDTAAEEFPVAPELTWADCPDDCVPGWQYQNGAYIPPALRAIDPAASLAAYRYQQENAGVMHDGRRLQTHRDARADWIGVYIQASVNPSYTVQWKTMDGTFTDFNAEEAKTAALAVQAHVQKCFLAEAAVLAYADTLTTAEQVTTAFDTEFASL